MQSASSALQDGADGDKAAKKSAAQQRTQAHTAWKQTFFQSRPPPACLGQLRRRQRERLNGYNLHALMQQAVQHVHEELEQTRSGGNGAKACNLSNQPQANTLAGEEDSKHASGAVANAAERRVEWLRKMRLERVSRNPFTDLNIRSDPRRTTIMANLTPDTTDEELRVFADQFGRVLQVRVVRHRQTGSSRRYGFVEFALRAEACKAVAASRRRRLKGHAVIIDYERGRDGVPGAFLPKRLATALQVESEGALSDALTKPKATSDADCPAAAALQSSSAMHDGGVTRTETEEPSDDDTFLRSLLDN